MVNNPVYFHQYADFFLPPIFWALACGAVDLLAVSSAFERYLRLPLEHLTTLPAHFQVDSELLAD